MNFELRDIDFELSDNSNSDLSLDALGILMGTNKSSLYADYLRHYDELFRRYQDKEIKLHRDRSGPGQVSAHLGTLFAESAPHWR